MRLSTGWLSEARGSLTGSLRYVIVQVSLLVEIPEGESSDSRCRFGFFNQLLLAPRWKRRGGRTGRPRRRPINETPYIRTPRTRVTRGCGLVRAVTIEHFYGAGREVIGEARFIRGRLSRVNARERRNIFHRRI